MGDSRFEWVKTLGFLIAFGFFMYWMVQNVRQTRATKPPDGDFKVNAATGSAEIKLGMGRLSLTAYPKEVHWRSAKNLAHQWTISGLCAPPNGYQKVQSVTFRHNSGGSCYDMIIGRLPPCTDDDLEESLVGTPDHCE